MSNQFCNAFFFQSQLDLVTKVQSLVYPDGPLRISDPEGYVSHPLNGLGMLRRMAIQLKGASLGPMASVFGTRKEGGEGSGDGDSDGDDDGLDKLVDLAGRMSDSASFFPSEEDYFLGINGISLLQEAYDLDIAQMADGVIRVANETYRSSFSPSWEEMVQLGDAANKAGWMDTAINWYEEALDRMAINLNSQGDKDGAIKRLQDKISNMKKLHDKMLDRLGPVTHQHRCNPIPFDQKMAKKKKFKKARKEEKRVRGGGNKKRQRKKMLDVISLYSEVDNFRLLRDNFQLMCSGAGRDHLEEEEEELFRQRPPEAMAPLYCRHHHSGSPFLRLGPFKLEERSRIPLVAVVHEFLHPAEMSYLRSFASTRLFRSLTGSYDGRRISSRIRTSKQTWLDEKDFLYNSTLSSDGRRINSIEVVSKDTIGFEIAKRIQVTRCCRFPTMLLLLLLLLSSLL